MLAIALCEHYGWRVDSMNNNFRPNISLTTFFMTINLARCDLCIIGVSFRSMHRDTRLTAIHFIAPVSIVSLSHVHHNRLH